MSDVRMIYGQHEPLMRQTTTNGPYAKNMRSNVTLACWRFLVQRWQWS